MNWKTLALIASAVVILPLSANAAESNQVYGNEEINNVSNINEMKHHARGENRRGERGKKLERLLSQLDLTPEQAEQIRTIQEQSRSNSSELREQLQTQRQEMRSLYASDATAEEIRSERQKTEALTRQLSSDRFETMLQIREILTSEQRAKMAELKDSYQGGRFDS